MKKTTLLLATLLLATLVSPGQITALFVSDDDENEQNALLIYETLQDALPELAMFNAVDSARAPKLDELKPYQLVIWYCGSDSEGLYFWRGNDQDNLALKNYLDDGGKLWLMGSGFLNDRYTNTPLIFDSPFFVYDYLGIWQWFLETYADDGGSGVPQLDMTEDNPMFTLTQESLNWKEPPEPWVDGCKLTDETTGVYAFGPGSYPFYDNLAAFYSTAGEQNNLTFTFDPAQLDTQENISTLLSEVVGYYDEILAVDELSNQGKASLFIFPNPSVNQVNIQLNMTGRINIKLIDLTGNVLKEVQLINNNVNGFVEELTVAEMPGGIYFLRVEGEKTLVTKSLVIAR